MKRHAEEQVAQVRREAEGGATVAEPRRKRGISQRTPCTWRRKCSGLGVAELRRLKQLERENGRRGDMSHSRPRWRLLAAPGGLPELTDRAT